MVKRMRSASFETKPERHARKYMESQIKAQVLHKYLHTHASPQDADSRRLLSQDLCHVSSWVALLQTEKAEGVVGNAGLSPLRVLTRMLRCRREAFMTARLRELLSLVRSRAAEVLHSSATNDKRADWEELRKVLPIKSSQANSTSAAAAPFKLECAGRLGISRAASDAYMQESMVVGSIVAQKREQRAWMNISQERDYFRRNSQQVQDVEALLIAARRARDAGDAAQMCQLLTRSVAWLARPRLKPSATLGQQMTDVAKQDLRAALQTKVRSVIIACLGGLDLDDTDTRRRGDVRVSVFVLQRCLEGVDLKQVMAHKQWRTISSLIANVDLDEGCESRCRARDCCPDSSRPLQGGDERRPLDSQLDGGRKARRKYTPPASASLKKAALEAFRKLGSEATTSQLIDKIRSDPDIWSTIDRSVNREPSQSNARMRGRVLEAWEANVVNNFPQRYCRPTGRKADDGLTIWKIRPSSDTGI